MRFVEQVWYWRLAVLRVLFYMASVWIASFLILTEDFSESQWKELGAFRKNRIYLSSAAPAIIALIAFMDTTMGSLRKALDDSGKHITTVTTETTGPEKVPNGSTV